VRRDLDLESRQVRPVSPVTRAVPPYSTGYGGRAPCAPPSSKSQNFHARARRTGGHGHGTTFSTKDGKRTPLRPYMIFLAIVTLGVQLAPLLHSRIGSPKQGKVDQVFAFPLLLPLDSIVRAKGKLAPADATWAWALDVFAALSALEAVRSVFDSTTIFLTRAGATLLLQPRRVLRTRTSKSCTATSTSDLSPFPSHNS
jgi:hypothetical protein